MIDLFKKILFWLWNPKHVRLANGKIVDDRKRRAHSREIQKKIDSGEIKRQGNASRHYRVISKGKVILKGKNLK